MTADFLHIGHIEFLRLCSENCKLLIVGIMSDEYVESHKKRTAIMNQYQRMNLVKSVKYVHSVVLQNTFEFSHALGLAKRFWKEEFIIMDSDEHGRSGADMIIDGGKHRTEGVSSSLLRARINENTNNSQFSL